MKKLRKYSILLLLCFLISAMVPVSASAAVKLNKKSVTVNVKKNYTLKLTGASGKVTWSSSNKKIATVSSKGVVKGVKKGNCKITAKAGKKSYTCKVTVKQPVTSVKLNKTSASLEAGNIVTLKATASPSTANTKTVTWSSSDTSIATVSDEGVVKGVGNGTATITAIAKDGSGKQASCKVTVFGVKDQSTKVASVYLHPSYISLTAGNTEKLRALVSPSTASDKTVTWVSSNPSIATVSDEGVVKGVSYGTTQITATAKDGSGKQASCRVQVFYSPDQSTKVDLTMDNWQEYFEIIEIPTNVYHTNVFGDTWWTFATGFYFSLKQEYVDKIDPDRTKVAFSVHYRTVDYYISDINSATWSYTLDHIQGNKDQSWHWHTVKELKYRNRTKDTNIPPSLRRKYFYEELESKTISTVVEDYPIDMKVERVAGTLSILK
jgi:uncharacterized protein YjdB